MSGWKSYTMSKVPGSPHMNEDPPSVTIQEVPLSVEDWQELKMRVEKVFIREGWIEGPRSTGSKMMIRKAPLWLRLITRGRVCALPPEDVQSLVRGQSWFK